MAQLMPLPLTVCCFSKIQIGFTFLVPAHPGSPGKRAIKRVCVTVEESSVLKDDMSSNNVEILSAVMVLLSNIFCQKLTSLTGNMDCFYVDPRLPNSCTK